MILGIGTDLANIDRIQKTIDRFGQRFKDRVFTPIEQNKAEKRKDIAAGERACVRKWVVVSYVIFCSNEHADSIPLRLRGL